MLGDFLSMIPLWLGKSCHYDLKRYFCAFAFNAAEMTSVSTILQDSNLQALSNQLRSYNNNFTLPRLPSKTLCTTYQTSCQSLFLVSGLNQDCTNASNTFYPMSDTRMIIKEVEVPNIPSKLKLLTNPNTLEGSFPLSADTYLANCPHGYVIPDNPSNKFNLMIPASDCAVVCRFLYLIWSLYLFFLYLSLPHLFPSPASVFLPTPSHCSSYISC